jgi:hypothetical protein
VCTLVGQTLFCSKQSGYENELPLIVVGASLMHAVSSKLYLLEAEDDHKGSLGNMGLHDALVLRSIGHGSERPVDSYALLFTRDKKGGGEKRVINTVTISNNDNFKNRNNKAAIDYWPGK